MDVVSNMKFEDLLKNSALVISLITAFFYCSSMVYTHAYLGRLGLDSDVLERSFHAVVYHGFVFNLWATIIALLAAPALVLLRALLIIDYRRFLKENKQNKKNAIIRKLKILKFFKIKRRSFDYYEKPLIKRTFQVSKVFIVLLIALIMLARYEQDGIRAATVVKQNIANQLKEKNANNSVAFINSQRNSIITQSLPKTDSELIFLYCGARMCAGFDLESEKIAYIPHTGFAFKSGFVELLPKM